MHNVDTLFLRFVPLFWIKVGLTVRSRLTPLLTTLEIFIKNDF